MSEQNERPFSEKLETWRKSNKPKTLLSLDEVVAEKSFAIIILLLLAPSALPLPTGGVTNVFEVIAMLLALEMIIGRKTIWLPKRWQRTELGPKMVNKALPAFINRIRWFEKWSRPRNGSIIRRPAASKILGLTILIFTLGAFFAPPFSGLDTLPSLGVVLITLGIIFEDSLFLLLGHIAGSVGIFLIIGVGKVVVEFMRNLF